MIRTLWGRLADGVRRTVVHCYWLYMRSGTKLQIKIKEFLYDDGYLSKVVDDKKWWVIPTEVLQLICNQFFFTANTMGCQPTTSHYLEPLAPQPFVPEVVVIYCALSEYATGMKYTVMLIQDEYRSTFGPSPVISFTPEAAT